MPGGDESNFDLFEDDPELEQAAERMFEEENIAVGDGLAADNDEEEENLVRMMDEVEATPVETLPGLVFIYSSYSDLILIVFKVSSYLPGLILIVFKV